MERLWARGDKEDGIPAKTDDCWKRLLLSPHQHAFKCLPAGLMIARLQRTTQSNPADMAACIDEMHRFFTKYESLTKDDLAKACG
jgi:hypothetical protein